MRPRVAAEAGGGVTLRAFGRFQDKRFPGSRFFQAVGFSGQSIFQAVDVRHCR
jgi:hypothetical protein